MSAITARPLTAVPLTARPLTAYALGVSTSGAAWSPLSLFAAGEQGVYYDPSDFATLFQDSAGTTPVTTFGQPVGKMLDKSGRGNHATQATSSRRPVLARVPFGGRRNLLLATDTLSTQSYTTTAVPHCLSFTGTGTITLTGASTAGPLVGTGVSDRVSLSFTPTAASLTLTVSGSVTFAQLELGSTATAYQKVTTTYDVTEAGKADCWGLLGDGVDDCINTSSVNFTVTDKLSICAGVTKVDSAARAIIELGNSWYTGNGFTVFAGVAFSGVDGLAQASKGTVVPSPETLAATKAVANATTSVMYSEANIPDDLSTIRVNTVSGTDGTADKGTGTFGNYPLYMLARNSTAFFNKGIVFSIVCRGSLCSTTERDALEAWTADKAGVTL